MAAGAARARPRPGALHAVRPEPPARAHGARLAPRTVTPVSWLERTPTYKEKSRTSPTTSTTGCSPTRSSRRPTSSSTRPRSCRSGGPGGAPRAVARDRPGVQPPLRRDVPRAAGGLHRGADRPRHRRRAEDEQVGRQHDRHPRRARRRSGSRSCRWSPTRSGSSGPIPAGPRSATSASSSRFFGDDYEEIWEGERTARTGCVDTKKLLADRIIRHYAPARGAVRRADGQPGPDRRDPRGRAPSASRPMAEATMAEVRERMGLR